MEIDLEQYRIQFYREAKEILEKANTDVLKVESDPENESLLNSIFRGIHTIKGSAGSFELWKISEFSHHLEGLLASLRDKKQSINSNIIDVVLDSLDYIEVIIKNSEQGIDYEIDNGLVERIQKFLPNKEIIAKDVSKKDVLEKTNIPDSVLEQLKKEIKENTKAYYITILYGDAELQNGYDPFVLINNIRKNSIFYLASSNQEQIPAFPEFNSSRLYLKPSIYCISELTTESIIDLSFDSNLLKVIDITEQVQSIKEDNQEDFSVDPDTLKEFLISIEDIQTSIEEALLQYEKDFSEASLNKLYRYIHTIKGDASYIGLKNTVVLTHELETYLDELRKGKEKPSSACVDKIFASIDEIYSNIIHLNKRINRETKISTPNRKLIAESKEEVQGDQRYFLNSELTREAFVEQLKQIYEMIPYQIDFALEDKAGKKNLNRILNTLIKTSEKVGLVTLTGLCKLALSNLDNSNTREAMNDTLQELIAFIEGIIAGKTKKLGEILIDEKIISPVDLQEALKKQKPIGEILIESGKVSKEDVEKALRKQEISNIAKQLKANGAESQPEISIMKVEESKIDVFYNLVGEMVIARNTYDFCLNLLSNEGSSEQLLKSLKENLHVISRVTNSMQRSVMALRMVPVKTVFQKFHRVIRDIARKQKKEIDLSIYGEEVEIDKRVADTLSDPLIHLIRNSCDHGIESSEERLSLGKPSIGTITLKASYEGNYIVIQIADDGKGLNQEKIIHKAKAMGYNVEGLTEDEIYNLVFLPGLSTAEQVTDVSGRGVGMDVVLSTAKNLGGTVKIHSSQGKGTETIIHLPMSMGVSRALIVEASQIDYAIPLENVIEVLKKPITDLHLLQSGFVFHFRGDVIPIFPLEKLLKTYEDNYIDNYNFYQELQKNRNELSIVILRTSNKDRYAIIVDKLKKNMEIAIKPVPKQLSHIKIISGVTIMGDGSIVQVLNVEELV